MNNEIEQAETYDYPFHRTKWQDEKKHLIIQMVKHSFRRQYPTEFDLRILKIAAYGILILNLMVIIVLPSILMRELLK
jgi:hypothetical protein